MKSAKEKTGLAKAIAAYLPKKCIIIFLNYKEMLRLRFTGGKTTTKQETGDDPFHKK